MTTRLWQARLAQRSPIGLNAPGANAPGAIALLATALGITGCPSYPFELKRPAAVKEDQIITTTARALPADILFVVDNSPSMDNKQQNLRDNFNAFIQQLVATNGDYQIGVVTTDYTSQGGERAGVLNASFLNNFPFNRVTTDPSMCVSVSSIDHGCFRGPDAAKRIINTAQLTPDEQIAAFRANATVGSCGSGIEQGLLGVVTALKKATNGGCNQGFLRDGANLVIVILSDENDTDDTPVTTYVDQLVALKPAAQIRYAAIVAEENDNPVACRPPDPGQPLASGAQCGQTVCTSTIPAGSGKPCTSDQDCAGSALPQGETCQLSASGKACRNKALENANPVDQSNYSPGDCGWCTLFNAPDCCYAVPFNAPFKGVPGRYFAFGRELEKRIDAATKLPETGCSATSSVTGACIIDTICQASFADTLTKIAHELVISRTFTLDPPPLPGSTIVVKVDGVQLSQGTDFSYVAGSPATATSSATPATVTIDKPLGQNQKIEIYFIVSATGG